MTLRTRVDVSNVNPISKLAAEQALGQMLSGQMISFEEYIDLLDADSSIPKAKLENLLEKRQAAAEAQAQAQAAQAALVPGGVPTGGAPEIPSGPAAQERQLDTLQAMLGA